MQNRSQVGGILTIISGVFGIIGFLLMIALIIFFRLISSSPEFGVRPSNVHDSFTILVSVYGFMGFVLLILGVVGIIGGVYAMKRRAWGLALAGAICGIFSFFPIGIAATVFVAMAYNEFGSPNRIAAENPESLPRS